MPSNKSNKTIWDIHNIDGDIDSPDKKCVISVGENGTLKTYDKDGKLAVEIKPNKPEPTPKTVLKKGGKQNKSSNSEFIKMVFELKEWFEKRDLKLGITDTHYGHLASLILRTLDENSCSKHNKIHKTGWNQGYAKGLSRALALPCHYSSKSGCAKGRKEALGIVACLSIKCSEAKKHTKDCIAYGERYGEYDRESLERLRNEIK